MSQARTPERWGGKEGERFCERRDEPRLRKNGEAAVIYRDCDDGDVAGRGGDLNSKLSGRISVMMVEGWRMIWRFWCGGVVEK